MQEINIRRKSEGGLQKPPVIILKEREGIPYFTFPILEDAGIAEHFFSTRLGGVSEGSCATLNFSFSRGDREEAVRENFSRAARLIGCSVEDMVCSDQTHTVNIRKVTARDRGKGLTRPRDYADIDGLVTNEKGVCLALFFADCVPVYFIEPVKQVIGLAHSGWKGTAGRISSHMVKRMVEEYGCNSRDIIVAIGPSICQDCYEVSEEVADIFRREFPEQEMRRDILIPGKEKGKYQLGLWNAIVRTLLEAGIDYGNIAVTDVCTCCNPKLLFSHRASQGKRGNLGAFLMLKKGTS